MKLFADRIVDYVIEMAYLESFLLVRMKYEFYFWHHYDSFERRMTLEIEVYIVVNTYFWSNVSYVLLI